MDSTSVSIIIPLKNREKLIPFTLASIAPDRHPGVDLETIVVDDGSTDEGVARVSEQFPDVRVLRRPHSGVSAARNAGLAATSAPFVLFLDSDDLVEPEYFPPKIAALDSAPSAVASYGTWLRFAGEGAYAPELVLRDRSIPEVREGVDVDEHMLDVLAGQFPVPHALLWRRSALDALGGFDEALVIGEDIDLMFRALLEIGGFVGCRAPRALYREHAGPRGGTFVNVREKVEQILAIRLLFAEKLERAGRLDERARRSLGQYYFDFGCVIRHTFPELAEEAFDRAQALADRPKVTGRIPLRIAARLLGPRRAVALRDRVVALRKPRG